ncbi:hypothetical protein Thexy_0536 [Thermoanaerobacterium xylanolyticum LX-11]|uniref:Uncharacterized protein n=1 Tax=Thermoanaerobacterium xylanolyticum (strain ATCC 49914 / DSM 7097 / LX-11) TaxID=858215 RepID=F6BHK6_THEXL|nr:hypothetical protein Thexy_0536 [Thermoanaerobacterium xylanolyticum LX-11]
MNKSHVMSVVFVFRTSLNCSKVEANKSYLKVDALNYWKYKIKSVY